MKTPANATNANGNSPNRKAVGRQSSDTLQSTLQKVGTSGSAGFRPSSATNNNGTTNQIDNYQDEGMNLLAKITQLEKDLERRQESYITRERAYKVRIDELEEELASQRENKIGWMKSDTKIGKLKAMHSQILNNVELVQDRTARILQEQERDLLRAFRARLFDVQAELEKEKNKKDDGASAWIEKSRQLEAEVEWAKEVADRLERVNQTLLQENNRLKSQFTSQEEDRNFLIKQLVSVKKDNARLRAEYNELEKDNEQLKEQMVLVNEKLANLSISTTSKSTGNAGIGGTSGTTGNNAFKSESEEKYKELNNRLRRLLAEERKSLQQVRQNYANELKIRTDMEMLLRQSVEDVRKEISRRYVEDGQMNNNMGNDLAKLYSKQPSSIPIDDFTQSDRERVLELLLSQERVVSLIYAKTFPINPVTANREKGNGHDMVSLNPNGPLLSNDSIGNLLDGNHGNDGDDGLLSPDRPSTTSAVRQQSFLDNGNNGGMASSASKIPSLPPVGGSARVTSR